MTGYIQPRTVADALDALTRGRYRIIAGGTDIYPEDSGVKAWGGAGLSHKQSDPLLDISRIAGLKSIDRADGTVTIGAAVTWSEIADAGLPAWFDGLRLAAKDVGGRQIQNQATLIGNICNASPAADGVPPLLTLNASVEIASAESTRLVSLSEFIRGNRETQLRANEMATAIRFTEPDGAARSTFVKLGARSYLVISIASVALIIAVDGGRVISDARISVGACSAVAQRVSGLEAKLIGTPIAAAAAMVAGDDFDALTPISDVRGSADYRLQAAQVLTRRAIATLAAAFGREAEAAA